MTDEPDVTTFFQPLLISRTGGADAPWRVVHTAADSASSRANALSAAGPDDVRLVGDAAHADAAGGVMTEHWDGRAWTVHPVAAPGATYGANLLGVADTQRVPAVLTSVAAWKQAPWGRANV